jgi:hypothetical protein
MYEEILASIFMPWTMAFSGLSFFVALSFTLSLHFYIPLTMTLSPF